MSSDPFLVDERANDPDAGYIIQVLFNGLHSDRKPFAFQLCMDADRGLQSGCDAADRLTVKAKDVLFIQNVKFVSISIMAQKKALPKCSHRFSL